MWSKFLLTLKFNLNVTFDYFKTLNLNLKSLNDVYQIDK